MVIGSAVASLALSSTAFAAPTLTLTPTIQRFNQDGTVPAQHPMPASTQGLNFDDCNNNVKIRFTLSMSTVDSGFSVQAFAGPSDCGPVAARTASTAACWPVLEGNIAQAISTTVDMNVRDIVSQIGRTGPALALAYSPASASVCSSGISGASQISVYFIAVPNGNGDTATGVNSAFKVKLTGPPAPTVTSVGAGDGLLNVNWTAAKDSDTQGFYLFTDPPLSAISDAGAVTTCTDAGFSDGGVDDGGNPINIPNDASCTSAPIGVSDGSTCGATSLQAGVAGSLVKGFATGTPTGNTSSSQTVTGLTNGLTYNVAVAASDSYGNIGPISAPTSPTTCGTPAPIDDFWKIYRNDGGVAGGSCDVSQRQGAPLFGAALLGIGVAMLKRRRR